MRLVHLSDFHLGYRQYQRLTPTGINQREADVARSFQRAVDRVIALRPDVILVAGDVFHTSRPTNAAILHAFRQFLRLRTELPQTAIVMIAGDHDTPRTSESGSIMGLFEQIGVHVAATEARRIAIPELNLAVLAVPDLLDQVPMLVPDQSAKHNVLLIHAHVKDVVPQYYSDLDRASLHVSRADLGTTRWDYVALGHYHVHRRVAENAFYSGSLDYTNLDIWYELNQEEELGLEGKGFISFDTDTGRADFQPIPRSREFIDLKPINAKGLNPAEVDAAIAKAVGKLKGGVDDKVVRLVVRDISRQVAREIDHKAVRELKRRAINFHLDTRRPETSRRDVGGSPTRRPSVADVVREQLNTRALPSDLDRPRLVELGLKYLDEAESFLAPAVVPADIES